MTSVLDVQEVLNGPLQEEQIMMECMTTNPAAKRRYYRELFGGLAVYMVLVFASVHWIKHGVSGPLKYLVAIMPVFPALMVPVAVVNFVRSMDELQRRIQLEGLAFAFTLTAVLTMAYGFLENAGLPQLSWTLVWPLMGFLWAVGTYMARRRYR